MCDRETLLKKKSQLGFQSHPPQVERPLKEAHPRRQGLLHLQTTHLGDVELKKIQASPLEQRPPGEERPAHN